MCIFTRFLFILKYSGGKREREHGDLKRISRLTACFCLNFFFFHLKVLDQRKFASKQHKPWMRTIYSKLETMAQQRMVDNLRSIPFLGTIDESSLSILGLLFEYIPKEAEELIFGYVISILFKREVRFREWMV